MRARMFSSLIWHRPRPLRGLEAVRFRKLAMLANENGDGRSGVIRTHDPLLPKQMRYQAALRSDNLDLSRVYSGFLALTTSRFCGLPIAPLPKMALPVAAVNPQRRSFTLA